MSEGKLRFLVDVGVGKHVEHILREDSHEVKAVRDVDPSLKDEDIIRKEELMEAWNELSK